MTLDIQAKPFILPRFLVQIRATVPTTAQQTPSESTMLEKESWNDDQQETVVPSSSELPHSDNHTQISSPPTTNDQHQNQEIKFYNYHEYKCPYNESIIITHHPNPYPFSLPNTTPAQCRIVRIPRLTTVDYPQFSNVLPGYEAAALPGLQYSEKCNHYVRDVADNNGDGDNDNGELQSGSEFTKVKDTETEIGSDVHLKHRAEAEPDASSRAQYGLLPRDLVFHKTFTYMGQRFGPGSVSPLSLYISTTEFTEIMDTINALLYTVYKVSWQNAVWMISNTILLDIPSLLWQVIGSAWKHDKLRTFVEEINGKFAKQGKPIRIVQPAESGYLSLDWLVPSQE